MKTQKIQITLTPQEVAFFAAKGKRLGYNVTKYIKFIVSQEAEEIAKEYPTIKMSESTEKKILKAIADRKAGKLIKLDKVEDLLTI